MGLGGMSNPQAWDGQLYGQYIAYTHSILSAYNDKIEIKKR
jgi:hypothetical protein